MQAVLHLTKETAAKRVAEEAGTQLKSAVRDPKYIRIPLYS